MSTELQNAKAQTFIDIFSAEFTIEGEKVKLREIVIPKIQRDYAQGRNEADVCRVRDRFLTALEEAIRGKDIALDFVYGDIDANGRMTPLDGQQRLTTLFLLHVYAARKEGVASEECEFLNRFTYETRPSSRDFCQYLVNEYKPSFERSLKEEIIDQPWFPLDWQKDPTISSMLVMLDAIHEHFAEVPDIWKRLKGGTISFYFLLIRDMGLTDELYIKMNSRGKPLTRFEHFKAELESNLRAINEEKAESVMRKMDAWARMLWRYRSADNIIDDGFLSYFRFICDVICYQSGGTTFNKSNDEFDLLSEYFSESSKNVDPNIEKFVSMFDCWCDLGEDTPDTVMDRFISETHEQGKIMIDQGNLFKDCLENYANVRGNGNRSFPLNRSVLLFAVVTYLQNKKTIAEEDFARRLRIVNNLVQNSGNEISERTDDNRLPAILQQVEKIICSGLIDTSIDKALNAVQLNEEIEKEAWLKNNQDKAELLFALEDHELLRGQISIVGLDNTDLYARFGSLFACDRDLVDRALMTIGFYAQPEGKWRKYRIYQMGSGSEKMEDSWRRLFHKRRSNIEDGSFEETKRILCELLDKTNTFTKDFLDKLINDYIESCERRSEFPMRYYYIKYPHFRPGSYGRYTWENYDNKPYEMSVLLTRRNWSEKTYQPFLKTIDDRHLSKESYGQRIILENVDISCLNDAYVVRRKDNGQEVQRIEILQNKEGIDLEDRIQKLKQMYSGIQDQDKCLSSDA